MGSKLPKKILRLKGLTMKQKWALHRRGGKATRKSRGGSVKKAKTWVKKQWGLGRLLSAGRYIDVLSRPAQAAHFNHGFTKEAYDQAMGLYTAGMSDGAYDKEKAKYTYGSIGTGLAVNYAKSKFGVYRGMGKGKILSFVQGLAPEILAASKADPTKDWDNFQRLRTQYDAGVDIREGRMEWNLDHTRPMGKRFWQDKGLVIGIGLIQKLVFNSSGPIGLNKFLPKRVNF